MPVIKLLAAAGDWAAGSVVTVEDRQAQKLIRTGYAIEVEPHEAQDHMGLRGAKRTRKERTH